MDDSGFAINSMQELMHEVTGQLTEIQGREMLARICHRNISIEPRPIYPSLMNVWTGEYQITAELSGDTQLISEERFSMSRC